MRRCMEAFAEWARRELLAAGEVRTGAIARARWHGGGVSTRPTAEAKVVITTCSVPANSEEHR